MEVVAVELVVEKFAPRMLEEGILRNLVLLCHSAVVVEVYSTSERIVAKEVLVAKLAVLDTDVVVTVLVVVLVLVNVVVSVFVSVVLVVVVDVVVGVVASVVVDVVVSVLVVLWWGRGRLACNQVVLRRTPPCEIASILS